MQHIAGREVFSQAEQMGFMIAVAEPIDGLAVDARGNILGVLD
jgi:hypothetical protein